MSELSSAIKQICQEKGLDFKAVVSTIELALAAAYRKDFGEKNQNIKVEFDPEKGKSRVFDVKEVVEDMPQEELEALKQEEKEREEAKVAAKEGKKIEKKDREEIKEEDEEDEEEKRRFNPKTQIQISDAKMIKSNSKLGDEIKTELQVPDEYGRMAAQTAKQVIIQKLREAERDMVFEEFKDKENEVVGGVVQRRENRFVLVDLGRAAAILPIEEQISGERYNPGERIKVYVKEVKSGPKGAEIIVSRKSEEILKKVFYLEIPEISNGLVEIKSVAREAGSRSKVAIFTDAENVDPIGSCVGQRGARIQTIISELGGEKVDIIEYSDDPEKYIANALSPAKVLSISAKEKDEEKIATVKVASDQLSLAIGKNGQNVRLAAKLTGWKIDIEEVDEQGNTKKIEKEKPEDKEENKEEDKEAKTEKKAEEKKEKTAKTEKKEEKEKAKKDDKKEDK